MFEYHLNLHYSQTYIGYCADEERFEYHLNLHYSQTIGQRGYIHRVV